MSDPVDNSTGLTKSGIELADEEGFVTDEQTMVMDPEELPGDVDSRAGILTDPLPLISGRVAARLGKYLGSPIDEDEFFPMMEWELSVAGKLSESDILQAYHLATDLGTAEEEELDQAVRFPGLTVDYLNEWLAVPIRWDDESVVLAAAYPWRLSEIAFHWRQVLGGRKATFLLAQRSHVERLITGLYEQPDQEAEMLLDGDASEEALRDLALEAPIVRLVNDMFARAVELGASDIEGDCLGQTVGLELRRGGDERSAEHRSAPDSG